MITSSGDGCCINWDISNAGRPTVLNKFEADAGNTSKDVMSISLKPKDENIFASGSVDTTVRVWDIKGNQVTHTFHGSEEGESGHQSDVNTVDFMTNGHSIASGSDDSTCRLFDMRSYAQIACFVDDKITGGITSVALSKGGKVLFAGVEDGKCVAYDVASGKEACPMGKISHDNRISCLGISTEGSCLATGSWDTMLKVCKNMWWAVGVGRGLACICVFV